MENRMIQIPRSGVVLRCSTLHWPDFSLGLRQDVTMHAPMAGLPQLAGINGIVNTIYLLVLLLDQRPQQWPMVSQVSREGLLRGRTCTSPSPLHTRCLHVSAGELDISLAIHCATRLVDMKLLFSSAHDPN